MPTVWERFDSMLGGIAVPVQPPQMGWREYSLCTSVGQWIIGVHLFQPDMIRLTCTVDGCVRTFTELLSANGKSRLWKFALSARGVTLQTEIFTDGLEHARDIVSGIDWPYRYVTGEAHGIMSDDGSSKRDGDLEEKRIRAIMQAEAPRFIQKDKGSYTIEMPHSGERSTHLIVCSLLSGGVIQMRSPVSTINIETEGAGHYLLRRSADLKGCRAALDESGLPCIVAFIPFSAVEDGGLLRRLELIVEGLFETRHVRALNHRVVNHLYQAMHIDKKGDSTHGIDDSRNQDPSV